MAAEFFLPSCQRIRSVKILQASTKVLKTRTQNIGQQAKPTQNKTIFIHINGGERSRGLSPCKPKFIC